MDEIRKTRRIKPQPGPQTVFLSSPADIAIYGGGAGGGKTFSLLLEPVRHFKNPNFGAVTFRRTGPQIRNEGGMWDASQEMYSLLGGQPKESTMEWSFPWGSRTKFSHMEHEKNRFDWQGSELAFIGWDELTHFTANQFWYMLSRNRSTCGIRPYVRATCNPDPDSWVADFISWWINQETGYPIPERAGVLRYFVRMNDELVWADSAQLLVDRFGKETMPKSLTYVPATIYDNPALLAKDPSYLANLKSLSHVDRERLLGGNWKIRPSAGTLFKRSYFQVVDAVPATIVQRVRYWDRAASEVSTSNPDPDWTVGVLLGKDAHGLFYVLDVVRERCSPLGVERLIKTTASQDGTGTTIWLEKDPGQAGKAEAEYLVRSLAGYTVRCYSPNKDKVTRSKPASAQAEAGNIKLLRSTWNKAFLDELEGFPDANHDDQVDAFSGAFNQLCGRQKATPGMSS